MATVVLLTPYTGGNLGDAAIQEAVIANIRSRLPQADIVMASLSPEDTTRIHGVRSFPIGVTTFGPGFPVDGGSRTDPDSGGQELHRPLLAKLTPRRIARALRDKAGRAARSALYWTGLAELLHIARAAALLRKARMLVVSGGGQLDDYWGGPWRQPYSLAKWTLLARLRGASVAYLSVGTCSLCRTSQALLRPALKLAAYRSFRDEGSRTLSSFAEFTRRDPVMPDLAFSLDALASPGTTTRQGSAQRIGVSPIAYLSRIWPESDTTVYSAYVNCLVRCISDMTRRGHSVSVFTSDPVDWSAVRDIESAWKDLPDASPPGQVEFLRTFTLQDFLTQVSSLDIFIASRLHGVLLAHLQSTPTVAVSYDRKVDVYMRDADQEAYRIDIRTLSLPDLEERVDRLSARAPEVRERLRSMRLTNRARLAEQYDHVFNTLV